MPMHENMFNRRCLSENVSALQVREGHLWFSFCFGVIGSKNFSFHVWADAATELAHSPLLDASLMGHEEALLGDRMAPLHTVSLHTNMMPT